MSDLNIKKGKEMFFLSGGLSYGSLIPVTILGRREDSQDRYHIQYENGSTDSASKRFLFEIPENKKTVSEGEA